MLTRALLLLAASAFASSAQQYDLLLDGGFVIDPANGIAGHRDVAIADGKVAAVAPDIPLGRPSKSST
ncbi:MAG: hypothetical protein R2748_34460 [Bryobacterales bacterium]